MVEFFLNKQSLTLFSRGNFTEISMISYVYIRANSFIETVFSDEFLFGQNNIWPDLLSINQHYCTFKNFVELYLIVRSACSLGWVGDPHPTGSALIHPLKESVVYDSFLRTKCCLYRSISVLY